MRAFFALSLLLLHLPDSQAWADEIPELEALAAAFEKGLRGDGAERDAWKAKYVTALKRLEQQAQQEGRLELLLAVRGELKAPGETTLEEGTEELARLRDIYEKGRQKLAREEALRRARVTEDFKKKLLALQEEFTRADQLDKAVAVRGVLNAVPEVAVPSAEKKLIIPEGVEMPKRPPVDLIQLVDLDAHVQYGKWQKQDGELHGMTKGIVPRFHIPYLPPEEYDFEMAWTQPEVRHAVWVGLIVKGARLLYSCGKGAAGFAEIGGFQHTDADNPSHAPAQLQPGRRHTMKVEVRRDGMKGYLDGELKSELAIEPEGWTTSKWMMMKNPNILSVGCDDPITFHYIRVHPISGPGEVVGR